MSAAVGVASSCRPTRSLSGGLCGDGVAPELLLLVVQALQVVVPLGPTEHLVPSVRFLLLQLRLHEHAVVTYSEDEGGWGGVGRGGARQGEAGG